MLKDIVKIVIYLMKTISVYQNAINISNLCLVMKMFLYVKINVMIAM